ncbi:MAG: methionyl-tRNA formyltransferase, partial [Planctomycetes bacterium]|nr:methionyl-tRNA formyltransferase [Planctomycetota bacterium]
QICNQVRALKPWPGTFTDWQRQDGSSVRVILDQVRVVSETQSTLPPPGVVVQVQKERVLVATGQGLLSIERIQTAGKRVMEIGEFLRGHNMHEGERFGHV